MAIEFDHVNHLINITYPQNTLSCQDLIDAIRAEEVSETGILYPQIATASGKEDLGAGVSVGITVALISPWQVKFWSGNYIAKVAGGNLVGGLGGDPIAYSAGVQVLLVQSAASTIVSSDGASVNIDDITNNILNTPIVNPVENSIGGYLQKIKNITKTIMALS